MSRKTLLLIEDSPHKMAKISDHIGSLDLGFVVTPTHSFTSGCKAIEGDEFDFVILDMSIPTFDKTDAQAGGKFRTFGGREIARKIVRKGLSLRIIVLTQYQSFSDKGQSISYDDLKAALSKECGGNFAGMIFYDGSKSSWKNELTDALKGAF